MPASPLVPLPTSRKIKDPPPPTPLDPKEIRQHVRLLIRHLASIHPRDTPRQTQVILNEIWQLVVYMTLQLQQGEPAQALLTLRPSRMFARLKGCI